jgi:DamX protein
MASNELFSSQLKNQQNNVATKSVEATLITIERVQKLDLLIHLIANLRQSLVICGPKGIGKATLLSELSQRKGDVWPLLTIKATSNLSFESIQQQIISFVMQSGKAVSNQDFSLILSTLDKQNQKIVILFESSGQLVPGLIATLIQFASTMQSIRLVFSLTHDELHLKTSSDQAIDSCHFIEMPPLSEAQCGLFLQHLSRQPNAIVSFDAINERMIAKLYQKTHGIPGQIMAELPSLSNYTAGSRYKWGYIVVISIIVTAIVVFFIEDEKNNREQNESLVLPNPEIVEISSPVVMAKDIVEDVVLPPKEQNMIKREHQPATIPSLPVDKLVEIDKEAMDKNIFNKPLVQKRRVNDEIKVLTVKKEIISIKKPIESKKNEAIKTVKSADVLVKAIVKNEEITPPPLAIVPVKNKQVLIPKQVKKKAIVADAIKDDTQWVLAQSGKNYTIQLIALSKRESVFEFVKKNASLKNGLRYFRKNKHDKTVFVLIYGLFKNAEAASKKMESLPEKYRKSWVRRFEILQKSISN